MRHGLRSNLPRVAAAWLLRPNRHPSRSKTSKPQRDRSRLTRWSCQYIHARGHSTAIRPPLARHRSATWTKCRQRTRKTAQWLRIFLCVSGPSSQLRCWYGDPPVHGMAPNNNVGIPGSDTAASAFCNPACVVKSSAMVSLITSQSAGARSPIRDSSPQQNSTIRRA